MEIDAKEILYSVISKMGKERVESAVITKPSEISKIIKEICSNCISLLDSYGDYDRAKTYSDLVEALMHYLLTVMQIPSERKVMHDDIEIRLVIPSLKQLKSDPKRALVMSLPKSLDINEINAHMKNLLTIQPNKYNLWLVLGDYDERVVDACKGLTVFIWDDLVRPPCKPLSTIMEEIKLFIETNKIKGFRILSR
ncbi:MAG: hypothetical protein QXU32_09785 [Nitrososphaerales archaeon]